MSAPVVAQGTQLQRGNGDGPPETFTTVGHVMGDLSFPQIMRDVKESTDHDSQNKTKEFYAGLSDPGQVKFTIGYRPSNATHIQLIADAQAGDSHNWQMVMTDGSSSTWSFAGFVVGFLPKGPSDGTQYTADVTIQVTGTVTAP